MEDSFVNITDTRDKFVFMLLDRIEKLTEEVSDLKKTVDSIQKHAQIDWNIRVDRSIDYDTPSIFFGLPGKNIRCVQEVNDNIIKVIVAYNTSLSGCVCISIYTSDSFGLYCSFDKPVDLCDFYTYLNAKISGISNVTRESMVCQSIIRTIWSSFVKGDINDTREIQ